MEDLIKKIKEYALETRVPIIMDVTLDKMKEIMQDREINNILEIGTAIGYSSLCFKNIKKNAKIETIERDTERAKIARENFDVVDGIKLYEADAIDILEDLVKENRKFDMIFIDAAKSKYSKFLEYSLKLLNKNGIIFADNILYKGYVMSDYNEHKHRTAVRNLREFIKNITEDELLKTEILEIGDGLAIIERK